MVSRWLVHVIWFSRSYDPHLRNTADGWYMSSGSADPVIHIFETQQVLATDGLNAYLNNRTSMYRIELDPQLKLLLEGKFPCFEMLDPSMYIICRHIVENLDEVHQC